MVSKDEFYQALVERHGADNQRKFDEATVAVCGLGGLGSNVAICLARVGIGRLILIDRGSGLVRHCWRVGPWPRIVRRQPGRPAGLQ